MNTRTAYSHIYLHPPQRFYLADRCTNHPASVLGISHEELGGILRSETYIEWETLGALCDFFGHTLINDLRELEIVAEKVRT